MAGDRLTFAAIVLVAIVAIVGMIGLMGYGGLPTITGLDTGQTGTAQVNITGTICIDLTDSSIDFGAGAVDQGDPSAMVYSNNTAAVNGSWGNVDDYFTIENCGNIWLDIDINISDHDFMGGDTAVAKSWFMCNDDNDAGACNTWESAVYSWVEFAADNTNYHTCGNLSFDDTGADSMDCYLRLKIPADAPVAVPSTNVGFVATTA